MILHKERIIKCDVHRLEVSCSACFNRFDRGNRDGIHINPTTVPMGVSRVNYFVRPLVFGLQAGRLDSVGCQGWPPSFSLWRPLSDSAAFMCLSLFRFFPFVSFFV